MKNENSKPKITSELAKEIIDELDRDASTPTDHWAKCITIGGGVRAIAVQAKDLVQRATEVHGASGESAKALGEGLIAGLLMAAYCKKGERINLNIKGDGRFKQALVDAYPDGRVRGFITENAEPIEKSSWGNGLLSVLRTQDQDGKTPYIGTVPLVTGELAKDLSFYWFQSEQVASAVGIYVRADGRKINGAIGFLIQALPGALDSDLRNIEAQVKNFERIEQFVSDGVDPITMLSEFFQDQPLSILERKAVKWECQCSRDRARRSLMLIGPVEIKSLLDEKKEARLNCDFCCSEFVFDAAELMTML